MVNTGTITAKRLVVSVRGVDVLLATYETSDDIDTDPPITCVALSPDQVGDLLQSLTAGAQIARAKLGGSAGSA